MAKKKLGNEIAKRLQGKKQIGGPDVIKEQKLDEATVSDLADMEPATNNGKGNTIEEILNECYEAALDDRANLALAKKKGRYTENHAFGNNVLFIGPTGVGKTSIIRKWANKKGLRLAAFNLTGDYLDFSGVMDIDRSGDKPKAVNVGRGKFDELTSGPDTILFIDEINKANGQVLKQIFSVVSEHKIMSGDDELNLDSLLFTVAAMNPSSYGDRDTLDKALLARFQPVTIGYDTQLIKNYLLSELDSDINDWIEEIKEAKESGNEQQLAQASKMYQKKCGQKDITLQLFSKPDTFKWPTEDDVLNTEEDQNTMSPRTLEYSIMNCDGTKEGFLRLSQRQNGPIATDYFMNILSNFRDKSHPANEIWGKDYSVKDDKLSQEEADAILNDEDGMATHKDDLFSKIGRLAGR